MNHVVIEKSIKSTWSQLNSVEVFICPENEIWNFYLNSFNIKMDFLLLHECWQNRNWRQNVFYDSGCYRLFVFQMIFSYFRFSMSDASHSETNYTYNNWFHSNSWNSISEGSIKWAGLYQKPGFTSEWTLVVNSQNGTYSKRFNNAKRWLISVLKKWSKNQIIQFTYSKNN